MTWLSETPLAVIRSMLAMLPRLEADQQLMDIQSFGVASGNFERRAMGRIMDDLAHRSGGTIRQASKPSQPQPGILANFGIAVVEAKPREADNV